MWVDAWTGAIVHAHGKPLPHVTCGAVRNIQLAGVEVWEAVSTICGFDCVVPRNGKVGLPQDEKMASETDLFVSVVTNRKPICVSSDGSCKRTRKIRATNTLSSRPSVAFHERQTSLQAIHTNAKFRILRLTCVFCAGPISGRRIEYSVLSFFW